MDQSIFEHWEAIAAFLTAVVGAFAFLARYWFNSVNRGLVSQRESHAHLAGRVTELAHEHDSIKNDIRGHVEREEKLLWPKVDGLILSLAGLETRLVRIEANLPNGELKTLLTRFDSMERSFQLTVRHLNGSIEKVDEEQRSHNSESEDWKRRIVRLEEQYKHG